MTVSRVVCLHGIQPGLLFKWKKQYKEGNLTATASREDVVPAYELAAALKQVRELRPCRVRKSRLRSSKKLWNMVSRENG